MARDFHGRLTQATQSLTDLTVSYAKRVEEKNAVLNNNVAIEQRQTQMTKQAAKAARDISDMTTKIQEMEAQIRAYEIDNAELQDRVSILENESHTLQSQIHDLEYDKEQEQSPSSADDHTRSHRRDSVQRPRMDGNATSSRRDMDREREASYSGAVYVEHRRRSSEFYEGDTYRRGPRERNRDRSARDRPSIDDRFDAALYPATGRRIGRR
jgi:septal ring factor EnvC (AmiA/AmiB activator)